MAVAFAPHDLHPPYCTTCHYRTNEDGSCSTCAPVPPDPFPDVPTNDPEPRPCPDSSVHTDETYVQTHAGRLPTYDPALKSTYHSFRHSGWNSTRRRTNRALEEVFGDSNRLGRFRSCGRNAHVFVHKKDPDRFQVRSEKCRDRWCVPCSRERARQLAGTLADFVAGRTTRFITLTLKSSTEPLKELVDKLLVSFRNLRRHRLWKSTQTGGAAFLEVKWNPDSNRWHPHLHILSEGRYLPKQDLKRMWYAVTGDSFIVDIKWIQSREGLCSYVTKYVASPVTHSVTNSHDLFTEAIRALHGRRTATTYGTWRGARLIDKPESDDWLYVASWQQLYRQACVSPWARDRAILAKILSGSPAKPWKTEAQRKPRPPPDV